MSDDAIALIVCLVLLFLGALPVWLSKNFDDLQPTTEERKE